MAEPRVQRRLAAILCADVVGYSRLMRDNEAATLAAVRALRAELLEPALAEHGGRLVKTTGDGFLVAFASAVDAVEAGLAVQGELERLEHGLALRIGINLGDVVIDGDDVLGDGVNVAARLEALAKPGDIYVSASIHEQAADKLDLEFEDLGPQALKNIDRPVQVFALRGAPSTVAACRAPTVKGGRPVIAVLPFTNMSPDAADEYFSDGLTEDIITELARFRDCRVIARNSTFQYKGRPVDVAEIGRTLAAHYIVEGSVRRARDRLRVTAQLIEAATGTHLWAERYDRAVADVFAVQDDLTRTIAANLGVRLQDELLKQTLAKSPADLDAYDLLLRGRALRHRHAPAAEAEAQALLEKATRLAPDYARAWAELALTHLQQFFWDDSAVSIQRAHDLAAEAVRLDPAEPWGHLVLGLVCLHRRQVAAAERHCRRAVALNPNDPALNLKLGLLLTNLGLAEQGIQRIETAMQLDPLSAEDYREELALGYFAAGRYADAIAVLEPMANDKFYHYVWLAAAWANLGDLAEARAAARRCLDLAPDFTVSRFARLEPIGAPDLLARYVDGLHAAGVPD